VASFQLHGFGLKSFLIVTYKDVAPNGASGRQRVGAFSLDVAQAVDVAFADEQNCETNLNPSVIKIGLADEDGQ